ncbi:hypothetical protein BaRGS_00003983 [Batillaria attramentaria]|uniref:serine--tRNA ligase n=1 Tax=Batillaria attramentaria TaxID=370345 RepID=A0ABD0LZL4_9CAEN
MARNILLIPRLGKSVQLAFGQRVCSFCHQNHCSTLPLKRAVSTSPVFFKELYTQTTSFQRAHDIAEEKGVGDLEAGSVSPWTQPDAWEQAFVRPEPQLDWTFLCHPDNREKIRANIASRKGVGLGDIDKVVQLWNQHQTAKTAMEKQSLWQELLAEAVQIPNTSHPAAPVGDESQAHVVEIQGDRREFDFTPQTVVELGEALQLLRTDYLAMATGPRTYYFLGDLARLEQALVNFTVHYLRQKGFHLISVPDLLHPDVIESCGFSTQGNRTQVYKLSPEKHGPVCLAGTAEMSLGGFFANQTLDASDLPIKVAAVSRCYRAETSDIAEEKGIYRVHQFTKVEMFGVTSRDESGKLLQELLDIERHLFLSLGLHFRILDMPTEELGAPAHRKFDIETWMPGKGFWGEISSASDCTDFQSRRLNIQYCDSAGNLQFAHTVNGTACAVPRMIMALMENNQQKDVSVPIPQALHPWMGSTTVLRPPSCKPLLIKPQDKIKRKDNKKT